MLCIREGKDCSFVVTGCVKKMKTVALLLLLVFLHATFGQYVEEQEIENLAGGKYYFTIFIWTIYGYIFPNYLYILWSQK